MKEHQKSDLITAQVSQREQEGNKKKLLCIAKGSLI